MKVKLLKDTRIRCKAGEIVEVSQVVADYLIATKSAELVSEEKKKRAKK